MKLSERDKRRFLWALLIVLGVAAVLYSSINLFILPLRQSKVSALGRLDKLHEQIMQAEADLHGLDAIRAEVGRLQAGLEGSTNHFVLRPLLAGNLLVPLQNLVEPMAKASGVQIDAWSERGRMEMPVNKKDATMTIDRYQVELALTGPYAAVREFVLALERTNAYVCVTELEILGQAADVQKHKIRLGMEWPVFGVQAVTEAAAGRARNAAGQP